jgi:hypothetical protein
MAAKLTRLTHRIAIQLHLVAESCTICSSRFKRPVRKLLDTPLYAEAAPNNETKNRTLWFSGSYHVLRVDSIFGWKTFQSDCFVHYSDSSCIFGNSSTLMCVRFSVGVPIILTGFFEALTWATIATFRIVTYEGVSKRFRTESITKYTLTFVISRWEATQRVMAA